MSSDAPRPDRHTPAGSGAPIEISSQPIVLDRSSERDRSSQRDAGAVDVTPARDAEPGPGDPGDGGPGAGSPGGGRPSRRRKIVLGSVLAVSLAGAAVFGTVGWRIMQQKDATLATPVEVAGLTRDESESAQATIEYLRTAVNAEVDFTESFGAVYTDPASPDRSVLLFGGTALIWQPERDLDLLFDLAAEEDTPVAGIRTVDAGPLGGTLKCGTAPIQDGELVFCGWADHGSITMGMFAGRSVDESAALLRDIRGAVQSRD
ncbi:hypothetical protein O7626_25775 [Micromonospora sp. WMMD1102]|uniref:hypothetical protein n=1 Tax=Micromonospora sp. WMMD1102 TaxID=3016105 RepID=UPI0024151554|nr:hypothetical protein [Micromonospora sp. WMMD1102]MDG4789298.1 hypothetical protein [Micromonospora sp. WMMD1102]